MSNLRLGSAVIPRAVTDFQIGMLCSKQALVIWYYIPGTNSAFVLAAEVHF